MKYKTVLTLARILEAISIWAIGFPIMNHYGFNSWEIASVLFGVAFIFPSQYKKYS